MVKETISLLRAPFLVESGKMIKRLKANSRYSMVMYSMEVSTIMSDIKASIGIRMAIYLKGLGKMMSKRDLVSFTFKMVKNTKGDSNKVKNMVKVFTHGKMVTDMKDHLLMTNVKASENTTGAMVDFIRVSGKQTE